MNRRRFVIFGLIAVAVACLLIPSTRARQDLGWIDAVSGSWKTQTVWRVGPSSPPIVKESPLAARYRQLKLVWDPDWRCVKGTYLDLFGRTVGHEHGATPEIYDLSHPDLQSSFVSASTDDEIRDLYHVMTRGTPEEKEQAVEAAGEKALRHLARQPG